MNPFSTITDLKSLLAKKEITAQELVTLYAHRIKKYNDKLNAVIEVFDNPVQQTTAANGLLSNIPTILKDNICQKNHITSAASKILSTYSAPYNATIADRLDQAGAIRMGRANMDEFAMGGSGEFSAYGPTRNPWNTEHVPGGSSSGSAAAVAAGLVPFALGTETGGSVRQPAAYCNLVGLYPTYGLNPRYGLIAFASSTDQIGAITRTVYDNALVLSTIAGQDKNDATSLAVGKKDYTQGLDGKLPGNLKIGVIKDALESEGVNPEVKEAFERAIEHLKKLGATISYIDMPNLRYGIALYFIISRAEAASNLYRYDGTLYGKRDKHAKTLLDMYLQTRHDGFGAEVKRRILVGNYVLSAGHKDAYYNKAQHIRNILREEFNKAFSSVDVLISPTSPMLPQKIGELVNDPIGLYLCDYFTVPNCIIGTPALSVPCGLSKNNLPIGFQFFGPHLSEELLFKIGHAFQENTDYHLKTPRDFE